MKQIILKSIILSSFIFVSMQLSAQDNSAPEAVLDYEDPDTCVPYPSCAQVNSQVGGNSKKEKSELAKLWEKLTKEMKETVDSLPLPTNPE